MWMIGDSCLMAVVVAMLYMSVRKSGGCRANGRCLPGTVVRGEGHVVLDRCSVDGEDIELHKGYGPVIDDDRSFEIK